MLIECQTDRTLPQAYKKIEEASKFELRDFVSLEVIDDKEAGHIEQKEEEDKEVQWIITPKKETKQKLI